MTLLGLHSPAYLFWRKIGTQFRTAKFLNWGDQVNSDPDLAASPHCFFPKLESGRNPPNPATWLVPRAGGILRSSPLTPAESLAASFTSLFVCCLWISKNRHFQTIFLLKLALLLALAREKWILLFRHKHLKGESSKSARKTAKVKQNRWLVMSLQQLYNRAVSTAILPLCTVCWRFLPCL